MAWKGEGILARDYLQPPAHGWGGNGRVIAPNKEQPTAADADSLWRNKALIERYLSPPRTVRCGGGSDHGDDCLCDVDLSLTADLKFDQVPLILRGVDTVDDLVAAAATLWLEHDVRVIASHGPASILTKEPEVLSGVIEDVKAGCSQATTMERNGKFDPAEFYFLRRLFDAPDTRAVYDERRIIQLHDEGLAPPQITRQLHEEGFTTSRTKTVAVVLRRCGIVPRDGNKQRAPYATVTRGGGRRWKYR